MLLLFILINYSLLFIWCEHIGGKITTRPRNGGETRRVLMTDELREELAQAAAATSQAYAAGARNLSAASSLADANGRFTQTVLTYLLSSLLLSK